MIKNILRVKQRADQGLGRAEKTEVLSEDLLLAEKKVEALKNVLQTLVKKLTASLQAHNVHDQEKRAKKMPIVHLATSLEESSKVLGEGMLCDVLRQCSMGMNSIGYAQQFYELTVEGSILSYIQEILDTDVPAIKKSKQQLTKLTLDMDSTRSRQQSAAQSSSHSSHSQSKTELLNVELEEAEQKVATCRDQYTTEIFQLLSKESDICLKIIEWMTAQISFYKTSLTHLEDMVVDLRCMTEQHATKPVYGCSLEEHLQSSGRKIALVIEECIHILYPSGLEEEGLFRIAAGASILKKLKATFDVGVQTDMTEYHSDYHVVAGALKLYIRELPEPLLTYDLYDEFIQCMNVKDRGSRLQQMWSTVDKLPKPNFENVKYLIKFLAKLAEKSEINKMTPSNISIVFGPNLLRPRNSDPGSDVVSSAIQNHVVETLILHHDYFFPGDFELHEHELQNPTKNTTNRNALDEDNNSKSYHNGSQSVSNSASDCTNTSFMSESLGFCSQTVGSTDNLAFGLDNTTLRKKTKRMSFPFALNSAGDKIFGKKRSENSKTIDIEKKDKKTLKDFLGIKRSSLKDKSKEFYQSNESGMNYVGSGHVQSPTVEVKEMLPDKEPASQAVLKPRYTPIEEKRLDVWQTGTADAPLAGIEGDDSPLVIEPPVRHFPLSNNSLPYRVHGDMYDTAFALTSLKTDGSASPGLQYLNKVHSVVNNAYVTSPSKVDSELCDTEDIEFADADSSAVSRSSSSHSLSASSSITTPQSPSNSALSDCKDSNSNARKHAEPGAGTSAMSSSQLSVSSLESSNANFGSSPLTYRKSKKHAPPPPNKDIAKPNRPDTKPPDHNVIKKPTIPPPGPPVKSLSRPLNAPPPKPAQPPPQTETNSPPNCSGEEKLDQATSSFGTPARSLSDSATPTAAPKEKTHTRNASAVEIKTDLVSSTEVNGHNRTKSQDFKLRQPPPIPQRTHSLDPKRRAGRIPVSASTPPAQAVEKEPVADPDGESPIITEATSADSELGTSATTVDQEATDTDKKYDYRDRMNSQTDDTPL